MKNCSKCFWCRIAFHPKWIWKCKMGFDLGYKHYTNHPKLYGWRCKHFLDNAEFEQMYEKHHEMEVNADGSSN